jgi:peptidyl-prolyl cis-trans isomerase C
MLISVNGACITEQEIARETQHHPANSLEEAQRKAAQALVIRVLLLQEAERQAINAQDMGTDEERIAALIAQEVRTPVADADACRRYYETRPSRFRSPDLFEARHILLPAKPNDAEALQAARAKAEVAIEVLKRHPERFAELARELSACQSAKQGGNLGQLTRGSTVPEIETFMLQLMPGQLCPVPIRSRYGYHVLRLERRVEGETLPFEVVHGKIAAYLEERVWRQAVRQYIQILAGRSEITGITFEAAASPLVQ